ncbi:MAG: DNA-processing protein DprA [Alphaproteobacteria bacterium]
MTFKTQVLSNTEKLNYLRLIRSENIGPVTFFKLMNHFSSAEQALLHVEQMAKNGGKKNFKVAKIKNIEKEIQYAEGQNIKIIAFCEPEYPPLLRHIHDPPPILYAKGHIDILRKKSFAIVGARNASLLGKETAFHIAAEMGKNGVSIVSGMAKGIDAKAHEGALPTGTVAVLGGGVDVVYPKENAKLYEHIADAGAVISEAPLKTQPLAKHFPRRNRIISGMCRGILVVEAARASGSLITANMAIEQGREVFAIPGHPSDERTRGPNKLIKQGAILTEEATDILGVINDMPFEAQAMPASLFDNKIPKNLDEDILNNLRIEILELLSPSPIDVDVLIRELDCPYGFLAHILLELELAGKLVHHPGNKVSIIK